MQSVELNYNFANHILLMKVVIWIEEQKKINSRKVATCREVLHRLAYYSLRIYKVATFTEVLNWLAYYSLMYIE